MASVKLMETKDGKRFYKISVSRGHGLTAYTERWYIPDGVTSKRAIEKALRDEVNKFEIACGNGEVLSRAEKKEKAAQEAAAAAEAARKAAEEAAKIKTVRQYATDVFMPAKEATLSENARASYQMFIDRHILPVLGDIALAEVKPAMITKLILDFQKAGYAHASAVKLYTEDGKLSSNGLYTTDANGRITITGVTGTLAVTATKTITGYTINEGTRTQTVVVKPDDGQTLTFLNDPMQTLTLQKYVTGTTTPIPGVTFHVTDSSGAVVGQTGGDYITDENGRVTISGLVPGTTVTARETKTVSGFVLDSTPKSILIKSGTAQTLTFYNGKKGTLIVKKQDSATGAALAGAEFRITTISGDFVDDNEGQTSTKGVYVTDEHGEIRLLNVEPDTYVITETKAPEGYVLDRESQTVKVNANDAQTVVFTNPENARMHAYYDPYLWTNTTVMYILNHQEYLGHTVLGKTVCENFKTKKRRKATE